ncbi:NAD(P)-binding protein [Melanomma pulvis-pyrius CBS 109.77]|uniref:NAD(P)-binding protein n=1 Tax=Melanomma pulvis-pyrius CBS 109.77 TaxID=1314802 RepID=A0A6A6X9H4_9PLEO|nr:NAD(P)-binding protein [Melanomma pulvis-pyrius CBS 109.77]
MPSYVIVGASRGIGYQYLKTLSKDPSNKIIAVARNVDATQSQVTSDNLANVHVVQGDLTDAESLKAAAKQASEITGGAVDHLVVNGAYLSHGTAFMKPSDYVGKEQYFLEEFNASMTANVAGVMFAINAFIPYVLKSSIKKVIVISSGHAAVDFMAVAGVAEAIPYAISKTAVNMLVAKFAIEYKKDGIVFLAMCPGVVLTQAESLDQLPPPAREIYDKMTEQFQKVDPRFKGPMSPKDSVEEQLNLIGRISMKESGSFLTRKGTKEWLAQ